ncbi:restriction endonuclease subunit S [Streptomyces sp. NPDC007856]|uniref:restriction endonuclease subunit S n=1 Tax=Streptomyces sp. NPDC007856 TaxID=3364781 RepID=UPI0036B3FB45
MTVVDAPPGWCMAKIGDLFDSWGGHTPSKSDESYWGPGMPWVSSKDIKSSRLSSSTLTVTQKAIDETKLRVCPPGSVLVVVRSGVLAHTLPVAVTEVPVTINQDVKAFYSEEPLLNEWLALFLRMSARKLLVSSRRDGTTVQSIQYPLLKGTLLPVPPIDQRRKLIDSAEEAFSKRESVLPHLTSAQQITGRLDRAVLVAATSGTLTSEWRNENRPEPSLTALQEKREANRQRLGRKYKQPNLPSRDALPPIPDEWCWAALPELGELGRGKSKHRPRNDPALFGGPYPFIQTGDVARSGGRIMEHSQTYNERGLTQSLLWPTGTVCITIAANIANSALLTYPACFPDSVVGLIADEDIALPEYVELFMRVVRRDLASFAPATAQANINLAILSQVAVALPPIDEQREIVRRVGKLLEIKEQVSARLGVASSLLSHVGQAALLKTFRGGLVESA